MTASRSKDQALYLVVAAVLMSGAFLMFFFAMNPKSEPQVQGAYTTTPASVSRVRKQAEPAGRLTPQQMEEDASGVYW